MDEELDSLPWAELPNAYGTSEQLPVWVRQLASEDEQVRQTAIGNLGNAIHHQGSIYPATAYAVPFLTSFLEEPAIQGKEAILDLLNTIVMTHPVDRKMWYGEAGADAYGAWGTMPNHIPYKDSHRAIEAAIPVYITLLDAPDLIVRLEAAKILTRFPDRVHELWPVLRGALERERTQPGRADLLLALGRLAKHLPKSLPFFLERFQTDRSELCVFAAALTTVRLAKEAAPDEVAQYLIRVMLEAPPSLDLYLRLPCGRAYPWSASLWAVANIGPRRLAPLASTVLQHLDRVKDTYGAVELFARLLLFMVFEDRPAYGHPRRTAETLSENQRHILAVLIEQEQLWHNGNFLSLLKGYGLPDNRQEMAKYLGQQAPMETPQESNARQILRYAEVESFFSEGPKVWNDGENETPLASHYGYYGA